MYLDWLASTPNILHFVQLDPSQSLKEGTISTDKVKCTADTKAPSDTLNVTAVEALEMKELTTLLEMQCSNSSQHTMPDFLYTTFGGLASSTPNILDFVQFDSLELSKAGPTSKNKEQNTVETFSTASIIHNFRTVTVSFLSTLGPMLFKLTEVLDIFEGSSVGRQQTAAHLSSNSLSNELQNECSKRQQQSTRVGYKGSGNETAKNLCLLNSVELTSLLTENNCDHDQDNLPKPLNNKDLYSKLSEILENDDLASTLVAKWKILKQDIPNASKCLEKFLVLVDVDFKMRRIFHKF